MSDEGVAISILTSGAVSSIAAASLFVLLWLWRCRLNNIQQAGYDTSIRATICTFLLNLSIADFFAALSYVLAYFTLTTSDKAFCIFQALVMTVFETSSLFWTASMALLLWRVSKLAVPQDWVSEEYNKEITKLRLVSLLCYVVSWPLPICIGIVLYSIGAFGRMSFSSSDSSSDNFFASFTSFNDIAVNVYPYTPSDDNDGNEWCWIKNTSWAEWWTQMIFFYIPLYLILMFCGCMLILNFFNWRSYKRTFEDVLYEQVLWDTSDPWDNNNKSTSSSSPLPRKEKGDEEEVTPSNLETDQEGSKKLGKATNAKKRSSLKRQYISTCRSLEREELEQMDAEFMKSRRMLVWTLALFLILWLPPSVTAIMASFGFKPYALHLLQCISVPLQGLCNFVIYGIIYLDFPLCLCFNARRIYWRRNHYVDIPSMPATTTSSSITASSSPSDSPSASYEVVGR